MGLENAFVTGGGYKLLSARRRELLPARAARRATSSDPDRLVRGVREPRERAGRAVPYPAGAAAFAGATYDPTSHYRAAAVFDFHVAQGLTPERLRQTSVRHVELLAREFMALDADPAIARVENVPAERRAGFLAIGCPAPPTWYVPCARHQFSPTRVARFCAGPGSLRQRRPTPCSNCHLESPHHRPESCTGHHLTRSPVRAIT